VHLRERNVRQAQFVLALVFLFLWLRFQLLATLDLAALGRLAPAREARVAVCCGRDAPSPLSLAPPPTPRLKAPLSTPTALLRRGLGSQAGANRTCPAEQQRENGCLRRPGPV